MAETVANLWHGVIILADINTLFLCIVVKIRNSFLTWEAYASLIVLLVAQRLVLAGYAVLCSHCNFAAGIFSPKLHGSSTVMDLNLYGDDKTD